MPSKEERADLLRFLLTGHAHPLIPSNQLLLLPVQEIPAASHPTFYHPAHARRGIVNLMGMAELAPPDLKRISHLGRGRSTIISKTIKLTIPAAVRAGDMRRCFHA